MFPCQEDVLKLTEKLVKHESIVNTTGEIDIANSLFELIASFPYYKENPNLLTKPKTLHDDTERYNVMAIVKGTKENSKKTIILMGHTDTVGIDDFEHLKDKACFPNRLMEALSDEPLPDLVKEHLDSGEWYFGRGTLDMKSGVASHLYLLKYYSDHPEELAGNLVFLAECDEEDSSHGVLSALKDLKKMKETHQFEYIALINADFVAPLYEGDENRYIYKGSIGKLLPSFYITGAETHAGSVFEGLDPNFIAAELTRQISYNPDLCDEALKEVTVPPVSLKQTDLKPTYTIQTALAAYVYFNFFTHSLSPREALAKLKEQAEIAFDHALSTLKERHRKFCEKSGRTYHELPWNSRVLVYEDMHKELVRVHGEAFEEHMKAFKHQLLKDDTLDVRMFAMRVVEEEYSWMKDKSPTIILFYSSLYSAHIEISGKNEREQNIVNALEQAVEEVQPDYPHPIVTKNFFPYVCDMSQVSLGDNEKDIDAIFDNNPAWGTKHYVEYQDIIDLNIPSINIGPYGYDAHSRYERMEKKFSAELVPNITNRVIQLLLSDGAEKPDEKVSKEQVL